MTWAGESHHDRPACWVVRRRARARPGVLELSTARPAGPAHPGGSSPTTSTSSGWQARFTSTQPASPRSTRGCTNGLSGTSPHAPISAFRSWWQAISRVRLSQFVRQTDLVGAVPLMLIWVAGMGLWLSQGPAVSQANHGQRPANREPGDRCLLQPPPAEAGHSPYPGAFRTPEADQSRADSLSHRQLRASATDVKLPVAGHQPEPVRLGGCAARGLVTVPTAGLQGGSQGSGRRPGASARAVARTIRPVMAMSIPSPSLLRDRSTPAGDSETKRPPPDPTGGGQPGAAAAAMPSRPPTASSLTRARRNTQ